MATKFSDAQVYCTATCPRVLFSRCHSPRDSPGKRWNELRNLDRSLLVHGDAALVAVLRLALRRIAVDAANRCSRPDATNVSRDCTRPTNPRASLVDHVTLARRRIGSDGSWRPLQYVVR